MGLAHSADYYFWSVKVPTRLDSTRCNATRSNATRGKTLCKLEETQAPLRNVACQSGIMKTCHKGTDDKTVSVDSGQVDFTSLPARQNESLRFFVRWLVENRNDVVVSDKQSRGRNGSMRRTRNYVREGWDYIIQANVPCFFPAIFL